jgi:signal transduction histidine kinase/ActR/RegA family two-component response regulator
MRKRRSALESFRRVRLWPGNWLLKYRLLSAGIFFGLLSAATPAYMHSKLTQLADIYNLTAANWETLDRIHELDNLLVDTESRLRAYATSGNPLWLSAVAHNSQEMETLLAELKRSAANKPNRAEILANFGRGYEHWKREILVAGPWPSKGLDLLARRLMNDQLSMGLHVHLRDLSADIRDNSGVANREVLKASRKAVQVIAYGGIAFFLGFTALMLSLWYTLIPGLKTLVDSARELKKGNLDHRVSLPGRSEMAQLARGFNEMAISLKAQNEKLKELNRLKTDFVSTVSHELRTPLTAIKGSIGLILGKVTGPIPPETAEMLQITQKNTDRLIRLINEVLDVAKIEAGAIQMSFDKFSLVETISHAVLGIEAYAQTQGIRLVWQRPNISPLVVIDRDRIEQVITNLVSNAIKFTEPGGCVTVSCAWEGDRVVVQVRDTGRGIPEEFFDRIFQKFQQAESAANKVKEGTGLGLTIAKAIVEEHGGSIWVESKVGAGSTFSFSLPWNGAEFVEPKKPAAAAPTASRRRRILVIDNELDFITVMRLLLEHEGYEVVTAVTAKEGFEQATKRRPDLILLDVMMPDMDGFTLRRVFAANAMTSDVPIVFVTVAGETRTEPELAAAVHVIPKPIVAEEFKGWLRAFFSSKPGSRAA